MKMTFRWYGPEDPIPLSYIRQIPCMTGVVSAIYDLPVGEVWPYDRICALREQVNRAGLELEVIESVPVHEDIKLGQGRCQEYIGHYKDTLCHLGKAGVKCVCYNFMPIFDWTRTQLDKSLPDGSTALVYYKEQLEKMDPLTGDLSLPGWDSSYEKSELRTLFAQYGELTREDLWGNLRHFLEEIIPVAQENGISMAIHPDDPPWDIFGLPRLITGEESLDRFLSLVDAPANGLTLCTGSLGCSACNDVEHLIRKYGAMGRIHFLHLRNVKRLPDGSFEESGHYSSCGSLDMVRLLKACHEVGFHGYLRPDHGRMIWGETGKPGYGLYDRALGAMYLAGIWEALSNP